MWPAESWAIPRSVYGCPQSDIITWLESSVTVKGPITHTWSMNYHLRGPAAPDVFTLSVCVKLDDYLPFHIQQQQPQWPPGMYCILGVYNCPTGKHVT